MSSKWRTFLEKYIKTINVVEKSVIDIGGSQLPIKKRANIANCDYKILDLNFPHEVKERPDFSGDIQDDVLIDIITENGNLFDVAFCIEVSEYWLEPVKAVKNINKLLKTGGLLYISFHWLYPLHKPYHKDFLRYSVDGAVAILNKCGFEIETIVRERVDEASYNNLIRTEKYKADTENSDLYTGDFIIRAKKI